DFVRTYILPAMQAGALHENRYPLAAALGRAVVAKRLVDIARMERASAVACGPRVEASIRAIDPALSVLSLREIAGMSHAQKIEYAFVHAVRIPINADGPCEIRSNLWGRSIECSGTDGLGAEPRADVYTLTRAESDCPDEAAYLEVEFDSGLPVRANGIEMPMLELIESLETIAGAHGVGRIHAAQTHAAADTRLAHEAPAAVLLHSAYRQLEKLVIPGDLARLKRHLARVYANLVYHGGWFSPTREAIDGFVRTIQPRVTGSVRLKLFKAECRVVGRHAPIAAPDCHPAAVVGLVS
ncbi:MAG: argininosuccinate synthase, partial [Acidobacteria bacterium]|nr:argininosuccinate synthase [Acidobacteriota bacterium]